MAGGRNGGARRRWRTMCPLALAAVTAGPAGAQGWGGAIGYGNDNVYRGMSLTGGKSAWLADVHYDFGAWIVGVGASAERPPMQEAGAQLTAYVDRRWQFGDDWSAKAGLVHYDSPSNLWRRELDYNELTAAVAWRGRWRLSVALSPDTPGPFAYRGGKTKIGFAAATELGYQQPIAGSLSANAGIGYYDLQHVDGHGYRYGSVGLSYGVGDVMLYTSVLWTGAGADRYELDPSAATARKRWVTTVVWSF